MKRFRGGLVFKAHRLLYHSTLGLRVIKKKKKRFMVGVSGSEFVEKHLTSECVGKGLDFRDEGLPLKG